ncbi:MAG: tetratricopeptide repeat protein [Candidatus Delongbacteria bacterium]|nr:tetratricopeptide repeat protein [Candidatus Delongbacteria bacterium]MBN2836949.1 tetratricopeptide repeat protein [Candidatus Delongbacteria bacterium]
MKQIFILITIFCSFLFSAEPANFNEGIKLYEAEKYDEAIIKFESLLNDGYENGEIYYNLGNSYYRIGKFDDAILYYEKAKNFLYNDNDLNVNLNIAKLNLADKTDDEVSFEIIEKINNFLLSSNIYDKRNFAIYSIVVFSILFSLSFFMKKTFSKIILILSLVFFFIATGMTYSIFKTAQYVNRQEAIVAVDYITAYSSPDNGTNSKELFNLHRGTKVKTRRISGDFTEISFDDEKIGWILSEQIKTIN